MLKKKLEKAINDQINAEIYSAYLYASMASYFEATSLPGFANWMTVQAKEELSHAEKFYHFVNERGGRVILTQIDGPPTEWESPLAAFQQAYEHEQHVSRSIHALVDLAIEVNDHMAKELLQWFVAEQVEEESSADQIVQDLKRVGSNGHGILMLDRELATRVYTPPAAN